MTGCEGWDSNIRAGTQVIILGFLILWKKNYSKTKASKDKKETKLKSYQESTKGLKLKDTKAIQVSLNIVVVIIIRKNGQSIAT